MARGQHHLQLPSPQIYYIAVIYRVYYSHFLLLAIVVHRLRGMHHKGRKLIVSTDVVYVGMGIQKQQRKICNMLGYFLYIPYIHSTINK